MLSKEQIEQIRKWWTDPENSSAAFSGLANFKQWLFLEKNINVSSHELWKIMRTVPEYVMNIRGRKRFRRRGMELYGSNELWMGDSAHMYKYKHKKYFMVIVDCFNHRVYTRAMNKLDKKSGLEAFLSIVNNDNEGIFPRKFASDEGSEFSGVKEYCKKNDILYSRKYGLNKAYAAERMIQTLKKRLYLALRTSGKRDWVSLLPVITKNVNSRQSAAIGGLRPIDIRGNIDDPIIREAKKEAGVYYTEGTWKEQRENQKRYDLRGKFKVGQLVYGPYDHKNHFDKTYDTDRGVIYKVVEIRANTSPELIYVSTMNGHRLDRAYYPSELQMVNPMKKSNMLEIEKIVDDRIKDGKEQVKIKWKYHSSRHNTVSILIKSLDTSVQAFILFPRQISSV